MFLKFRRITRPRFATQKKLGIRLLFGYKYRAELGVMNKLAFWEKIVITLISIRVWTTIFERLRTGLIFVVRLNTILGFRYRASTGLRSQTFKTQLENESRVGTPIRRNLVFLPLILQ